MGLKWPRPQPFSDVLWLILSVKLQPEWDFEGPIHANFAQKRRSGVRKHRSIY